MTNIEIELGVQDISSTQPSFDPGVYIEIRGEYALALEVLKYLEEFTSPAGQIEVK